MVTTSLDTGAILLYGVVRGQGQRTLQLYDHFHVQSPEPLELWQHDPCTSSWVRSASEDLHSSRAAAVPNAASLSDGLNRRRHKKEGRKHKRPQTWARSRERVAPTLAPARLRQLRAFRSACVLPSLFFGCTNCALH